MSPASMIHWEGSQMQLSKSLNLLTLHHQGHRWPLVLDLRLSPEPGTPRAHS